MAAAIETLASYVPWLILRRMADRPSAVGPAMERHQTAVLFADISGFTALTEQLAEQGPAGAEELTVILNTYFERLIDTITAHGGDVAKMAGDALVALWMTETTGETLPLAMLRASACGLALQDCLASIATGGMVKLAARVGLGAGELITMHVGGVYDRWELLLAGAPLVQMGVAEHEAQPGDVVLSPEAWELVRSECLGTPRGAGCVRLESVRDEPTPEALALPDLSMMPDSALRAYIPGAIRARLVADQTGWLAELRRITVLFVNLPGLDHHAADALERTQEIMRVMQSAIYRYEGSVNKLSVDEKGLTLVAALGLPPLAHEDDASRAVQAALSLQAQLRGLGVKCSIGITTGRIYCGEIGSPRRREYTIMGDKVNLAARLMQASAGGIFCDCDTHQAAGNRLLFEELPPITVKGKVKPVNVFRPLGQPAAQVAARRMFGRKIERRLLTEGLDALNAGFGGVITIEGEAGIGKSRLLAELVDQARARGITPLVGAADAVEKSTPYFAWRPIIAEILGVEGVADIDEQRDLALSACQTDADAARRAPLLNSVLPLDIPENEITSQMLGEVRADNTNELLLHLVERASASTPTLVIIEDAHWLDSASWALTARVCRPSHPLLIVIATRPIGVPTPKEWTQLIQEPATLRLPLEGLPSEDVFDLIRQRLGVAEIPRAVESLILHEAEGNPFFSEELAYALRDGGLIQIVDGNCQIAPGVDLRTITFPDRVQGVVTSRIDRLPPPQQLALKAASVIGRSFSLHLLSDIFPIDSERGHLTEHIHTLERLDFTLLDAPEPEASYIFKHIITQEVAYNMMLFAQRRQLHRAVAVWYEGSQHAEAQSSYPLLAHHWGRAGDEAKTIDYLDKAGDQAFDRGAYEEAIEFLSEAIERDQKLGGLIDPLRRGRWERQLGDACIGASRIEEAYAHIRTALDLLGARAPRSKLRMVAEIALTMVDEARRRIFPRRRVSAELRERKRQKQLVRSYEGLAQLSYFAQDLIACLYAGLCAVKAAEAAGPAPELTRSFSIMCIASSLAPCYPLSEMYLRLAHKAMEGMDDLAARLWTLELTGFYSFPQGHWERGRSYLEEAVRLGKRLGHKRRWEESYTMLSILESYHDDPARAERQFAEIRAEGLSHFSDQAIAWGSCGQAICALRRGEIDLAASLLTDAEHWMALPLEVSGKVWISGAQSILALARGDLDAAEKAARRGAEFIRGSHPTAMYTMEGYAGVAEVYLTLWERRWGPRPDRWAADAKRACSALRLYARVFPIAGPRALLWTGRYQWLRGRTARARKSWRQALASAERFEMPYEQGLVHLEIGRHLAPGDPERDEHLGLARRWLAHPEVAFRRAGLEA